MKIALHHAGPQGVAWTGTFEDIPYHRTSFTFIGTDHEKLNYVTTALARYAHTHLNLANHIAQHPRLGVVDHISCSPLPPITPTKHFISSFQNYTLQKTTDSLSNSLNAHKSIGQGATAVGYGTTTHCKTSPSAVSEPGPLSG